MRVSNGAIEALLARYHIHAPVSDERYLHHADLSRGVALHIVCVDDPVLGKQINVSSSRKRLMRACPLSAEDAAELVREMQERRILPKDAQESQTIAHLLVRCSRLFVEQGLRRLRLAPVYVGPNDYHVGSAAMTSASRITAVKRLEPHAHDAHAVFAHRPTVRRKYDASHKGQS